MKSFYVSKKKKNAHKKRQKIIIATGFSSTLFACSVFAALYGGDPAEHWTIGQIGRHTTSVTGHIAAFGASFSAQMQTSFEQIITAVAIATKQEALAAHIVTDGSRQAAEQLVNAYSAQRTSDQVAQAYLDYHAGTGQGYDPCGTLAKNKTLDAAFDNISTKAKTTIQKIDVSPGRLVASTPKAMQDRLKNHRDKFCTESEANAGLCSLSRLPGGDTNASLLFESAEEGSLESEARLAYIQHVLGEPDQALQKSAGSTPAGETYMVAKNRKDALLSIPAYSLAMIDSANTQSASLSNKSPNDVLKIRVNQYFGGREAEAWSGALARQRPRGLIVEAAKMSGLEVWLSYKQYEQNQRIEANLAALVLSSAEKYTGSIETQYQKTMSDNLHTQVQ